MWVVELLAASLGYWLVGFTIHIYICRFADFSKSWLVTVD